jgi:inner membrane protein
MTRHYLNLRSIVYGRLVMKQRYGIEVSVAMSLVYGVLYLLVISEQYALLIGAIVIFAALATPMLSTRTVQWAER